MRRTTTSLLAIITAVVLGATLAGCSDADTGTTATGVPSPQETPAATSAPADEGQYPGGLDDDGKGPDEPACELASVGQICLDGDGSVAITWTRGYPHEGYLDFSQEGTFTQIDPRVSADGEITGRWEFSGETVLLTYSDGRLARVTFGSGDQPNLTLRLDTDPNNPLVYDQTLVGGD